MSCQFPIRDHVYDLSREFAFFLFINYAYIGKWMHLHKTKFEKKKQFSKEPSCGLKWENKSYKLKTSVNWPGWLVLGGLVV